MPGSHLIFSRNDSLRPRISFTLYFRYKIQGYNFAFFRKNFTILKQAESDPRACNVLIAQFSKNEASSLHKSLLPKVEGAASAVKLVRMVKHYVKLRGINPFIKGGIDSSPQKVFEDGDPILSMEEVEAFINNSAKPHDVIHMIMQEVFPNMSLEQVLDPAKPVQSAYTEDYDFSWMNEMKGLDAAEIFEECYKEMQEADGKFLHMYALAKAKPQASIVVFGAAVIRKLALAQLNTFYFDVKNGKTHEYHKDLEQFADGSTPVYCGKLKVRTQ